MGFFSNLFKKKGELERGLKSSDAETRKRAVEELGVLAKPDVVTLLVAAIKDSDLGVRLKAMSALEDIGERATKGNNTALIDQLLEAVKDTNWQVRQHAARALG